MTKDRMKIMSNEVKIQKTTGGVVHMGTHQTDYFTPICGSGVVYAPSSFRQIAKFRELPASTEVTCKKCLKKLEKAEKLGLYLEVRENEDGSSRVVDTRKEETPVPTTLAERMAQVRANLDAEAEARAAARRARNRVNYASRVEAHPVAKKLAEDHGLNFF